MSKGDKKKRVKLLKDIRKILKEDEISDQAILNRVGKFTDKEVAKLENTDLESFFRLQKLLDRITKLMHGASKNLIFSTFSLYSGIKKHEGSPLNFIRWVRIVLRAIAIAIVSPIAIYTIVTNYKEFAPVIDELIEEFTPQKGADGKEANLEISEKSLEKIFEITGKFLSQKKFFDKLGNKKNVKSILDLVSAEYKSTIKAQLKTLDSEVKALQTKESQIDLDSKSQEKLAQDIKGKMNEAVLLKIQQRVTINFLDMLQEQILNNDSKLVDIGESAEFVNNIIQGTLKQKEGDFITKLSESIISALANSKDKQLVNKESLKYFATEYLVRNYEDIRALTNLPKMQNEQETREFIDSAISASMDIFFDFVPALGNNPKIIKQAAKVISGSDTLSEEMDQFQDGLKQLAGQNLASMRTETVFQMGESIKNAVELVELILNDNKTLGKPFTQENFIKICKVVDKFVINQQIASLEMQNEMLPQTKKLTSDAEEEMTAAEIKATVEANNSQIQTLKIAQNILQKRAKEIHSIFGKDVGNFLKGIVETLKPDHNNPLTMEDMLLQIVTQATHAEIINENALKTLIIGIVNDNHEAISSMSNLIPKIKNNVSRETFVKHAVNTSVEMLFALGPAIEENKSLAKQAIHFGFEVMAGEAKEFTKLQLEMIEVVKDIVKQHGKELHEVFGKDYKNFLNVMKENLKPKQVVDKDGKVVKVDPSILDIVSGILAQSNKLDIVQKDKLKSLLKAIINKHKATFRKYISDSVGSALFFENIPDEQARLEKIDVLLDTLVDTMYDITSAIGKNSEVSNQIVQAIFEIVQSPQKIKLQSKKSKVPKEVSEQAKEDIKAKEKAVAKQRFQKVMQLLGMVTNEDRGKVTQSILKLVSTAQVPGAKDLIMRLQIGNSEIFNKHLPDAFQNPEFYKNFSAKIADILYPTDNKTTLENASALVNYINEFYKSNPTISKEQYEQEVIPQLIEIGFGVTRQFDLLDVISGYPSDLVMLFESLAKRPDEITIALNAGAQYLKSGIASGLSEAGLGGTFNILKAAGSVALSQRGGANLTQFADRFVHELDNKEKVESKISTIIDNITQKYNYKNQEAFYLKLRYIPKVKFAKPVDFTKIDFDQDIDFHKCDFQSTVKLNAENCNTGKLKFLHCTFNNLELDIHNAQDVKNAVRVIGTDTFSKLIAQGKITVNLKITSQDEIKEIRRAFATALPVKDSKKGKVEDKTQKNNESQEQLFQDNFSALLLTSKIDFQNSLSDKQKGEVSKLFYASMKTKKSLKSDNTLYQIPQYAQKQYAKRNVNSYSQFRRYNQYAKESFTMVTLRNALDKKSKATYTTLGLFRCIVDKYKEADQLDLLIHQGKNGSISIDPKVRNVVNAVQMLFPPMIACKYSDRFAKILEDHGIDAIEQFQEIAKLIDERSENKFILKDAIQIIIDDMVVKLVDNKVSPQDYFPSIIKQIKGTEKKDFDIKKLIPQSFHHTLLNYGIEDSETRSMFYSMLDQIQNNETKAAFTSAIDDILSLEINQFPENAKPNLRNHLIKCMYNAFTVNRVTLLDKLQSGEAKQMLHNWIDGVIAQEQESNKGWISGIFGKKEIGISFKDIPIQDIFNVFQGMLKLNIELLPEPKAPEFESAALYDFSHSACSMSSAAVKLVDNTLTQQQERGQRVK